MPTTEIAVAHASRAAADAASRTPRSRASNSVHRNNTPASGARLGRIAIAALIARPAASGRRPTVSTSASIHADVTGTSLIAFIN